MGSVECSVHMLLFFLFFFGHVLFQFLCNLQQYCNSVHMLLFFVVVFGHVLFQFLCNLQQYCNSVHMLLFFLFFLVMFYSSFCATYSNIVIVFICSFSFSLALVVLVRTGVSPSTRALFSHLALVVRSPFTRQWSGKMMK